MPTELTSVMYTTSASSKGGRGGHVKSADGVIDLELGKPGSASNPKANPETLFAAGYSACFQGALANRAATVGVDTSDSDVSVAVTLGTTETGVGLAVAIEGHIPGVDLAKAQELLDMAHQFCPYSNATRGNIVVTVTAV